MLLALQLLVVFLVEHKSLDQVVDLKQENLIDFRVDHDLHLAQFHGVDTLDVLIEALVQNEIFPGVDDTEGHHGCKVFVVLSQS